MHGTIVLLGILVYLCVNVSAETAHVLQRDGAGHLNRTHSVKRVMLEDKCAPVKNCVPGLILPVWQPQQSLSLGVKLFRALVYLVAMVYLFLGVSIVADRFMAAIEVITSQEREVTMRLPNGETTIVLVQVWNKTVSNLTLMALGSSAPEILLSIIEICGNGFEAGDLGPGTIVGSAAFNFYIIIAICIASIPAGEKRRIERVDVFWVTFLWSLFAYVWLYLILCVFSPNIVEVWEGVLTFAFFFFTVVNAYAADRFTPALQQRILGVNKHPVGHIHHPQISIRSVPKDKEKNARHFQNGDAAEAGITLLESRLSDPELQAFHDDRQQFVKIFQEIRRKHPDMPLREVGRLVAYKRLATAPKSRAFRRMQATRQITAGRSLLTSPHLADAVTDDLLGITEGRGNGDATEHIISFDSKANGFVFNFQPSHYICAEDVGHVKLSVKCEKSVRLDAHTLSYVDYCTIDGTAKSGEDYVHAQGTLIFQPNETAKEITVKIVDNDVYEFDEEFFVRLSEPRAVSTTGKRDDSIAATVGAAGEALVIIVDDDHAGHFGFRSQVERISESQGVFHLPVTRQRGARGKVLVPYTVTEGRAKRGEDFRCEDGQLIFHDHQNTASIRIEIVNDDHYEKCEDFYVQLGEPIWQDSVTHLNNKSSESTTANETTAADGRPILGRNYRCKVIINEDAQLKGFMDKLVTHANCSIAVGTSSWKQQFQEALSVSGADDEIDGCSLKDKNPNDTKQNRATFCQTLMHYVSLPWKLAFACIPPTDYCYGWVCFVVSIALIGVLTALIGDVAAMFGCTLGVKDSVTAITLVALGTSVPDTFASKLAAVQDETADASIGNVTGSNAVNVFLGIGVAWAMASIYHAYVLGDVFHVHAGSLANSLTLFLIGCVICAVTLQYRRYSSRIGAELGGPTTSKWVSVWIFVMVWILYIIYCIFDAYCIL